MFLKLFSLVFLIGCGVRAGNPFVNKPGQDPTEVPSQNINFRFLLDNKSIAAIKFTISSVGYYKEGEFQLVKEYNPAKQIVLNQGKKISEDLSFEVPSTGVKLFFVINESSQNTITTSDGRNIPITLNKADDGKSGLSIDKVGGSELDDNIVNYYKIDRKSFVNSCVEDPEKSDCQFEAERQTETIQTDSIQKVLETQQTVEGSPVSNTEVPTTLSDDEATETQKNQNNDSEPESSTVVNQNDDDESGSETSNNNQISSDDEQGESENGEGTPSNVDPEVNESEEGPLTLRHTSDEEGAVDSVVGGNDEIGESGINETSVGDSIGEESSAIIESTNESEASEGSTDTSSSEGSEGDLVPEGPANGSGEGGSGVEVTLRNMPEI